MELKMYIAVLDKVPDHMVPVLVAHTVLNAHLAFNEEPVYADWLYNSFRKVVVKVNQKELDRLQGDDIKHIGCYESTILDQKVCCVACCPSETVINTLKFAKMWRPVTWC